MKARNIIASFLIIAALMIISGAAGGFVIPFIIAFFISKANADKLRPNVTAILTGEIAEPDEENGCDLQK